MIDITRKDLSKQYPVYTKAGNIWKNRIDWNSILKPGTVVSTHFGIFTFVNTYKENKVWYIILSDGVNNYTVKRQQARNNKKLPKSATTQKVVHLANSDLLSALVEEVANIRKNFNATTTSGKHVAEKPLSSHFFQQITFILDILGLDEDLYKKYKRQLLNYYHPDKGFVKDSTKLQELNFVIDMYTHTKNHVKRRWGNA